MKFHSFFTIAALGAITILASCGNDGEAAQGAPVEGTNTQPAVMTPGMDPLSGVGSPNAAPAQAEPAQNAAGLWHYTCPKSCAGGSGSAIPCPTCGTTLVHSQIYHGTPNASVTNSAPATIDPAATAPPPGTPGNANLTLPNPGKNEPPQNAAGVWHYTCQGGCAGGGGTATPCPTCSKTLVHNKAYHQ